MKFGNFKKIVEVLLFVSLLLSTSGLVYAERNFALTPAYQKIVLVPGEKYEGTLGVVNPVDNENDFHYSLSVEPFFVDENNNPVSANNGDYNQIVNWVQLEHTTGTVSPNNTQNEHFTIDVPEDAPAGGQYFMIKALEKEDISEVSGSISIQNRLAIGHPIYAEVVGETIRSGEITESEVSSFLLSGNITGRSTVKNTGNVHGDAKYTLQVFPLFSGEEIYTNVENPHTKLIMPEREVYQEEAWDKTPMIGIFNVVYTVEFEGSVAQISKMVIICPIWLLFIIIFAVFVLIFYFVAKSKNRKKAAAKKPENA
jgi:hypothetical protein